MVFALYEHEQFWSFEIKPFRDKYKNNVKNIVWKKNSILKYAW